jgi:hypothetical protein
VEGDLFRALAVDGALGQGEAAKGFERARRSPLGKARGFYQGADVPESPVNAFFGILDVRTEGTDTVHLDPLGGEVEGYAETA